MRYKFYTTMFGTGPRWHRLSRSAHGVRHVEHGPWSPRTLDQRHWVATINCPSVGRRQMLPTGHGMTVIPLRMANDELQPEEVFDDEYFSERRR